MIHCKIANILTTGLIAGVVVIILLSACGKADEDYKMLSGISLEEWPLTDCSTSTKPARDLVAYKLLGVPYKWEQDWLGGRVYVITERLSK